MAEPTPAVRIRDLRLRVAAGGAPRSDAALREVVRRQLPAGLDPAVAGPLTVELVDAVRRAEARAGRGGPR